VTPDDELRDHGPGRRRADDAAQDDATPAAAAAGVLPRPSARARLTALRVSTVETLAALESTHRSVVDASRDSNADDEHDPEGSTIAFERAQVEALARQSAAKVAAIDAALDRVDAGTYGICASCGRPIPEARLEARPTATTCVECAARS